MKVEICASNFESAIAAQHGGADRIELCESLEVGGLTPRNILIEQVLSEINIPVHVLIRPRAGDFIYSPSEIDQMLDTIEFCKESGCSGTVCGALTVESKLDVRTLKQLLSASEGMEFTFHRAFDRVLYPIDVVNSLIELGIDRILSSGQKPRAVDGIELLKHLNADFGNQIEIMPGAGVDPTNVMQFKKAGFESVHLSAIQKLGPETSFFNTGVTGISDLKTIKKIVRLVH
jgi:copper homeostasis protein